MICLPTRWSLLVLMLSAYLTLAVPRVNQAEEAPAGKSLAVKVHFCHGVLGIPREGRILPGENLFVRYEVSGLATRQENNQSETSLTMQVLNRQGTIDLELPELENSGALGLKGTVLTGGAYLQTSKLKPGKYDLRVIATDRVRQEKSQSTYQFEVLSEGSFGARNLLYAQDRERRIYSNGYFTTGEVPYIHGDVVGFQLEDDAPKVKMTATLLDESGQTLQVMESTFEKSLKRSRYGEPADSFPLTVKSPTLNRPGKFRLKITLEDQLGGKSAEYMLPLIVADPFALLPETTSR